MKFRIKIKEYSFDSVCSVGICPCKFCIDHKIGLHRKIHEIDMKYADFFNPDVPIKIRSDDRIIVQKFKRIWSLKAIFKVVLFCIKINRGIIQLYTPGNIGYLRAQDNWNKLINN